MACYRFKCKCVISELSFYEMGFGKSKKQAKTEAAKKAIENMICIPDAQAAIIQIMMATSMNENLMMIQDNACKKRMNQDIGTVGNT
jgi:hypothetical protein